MPAPASTATMAAHLAAGEPTRFAPIGVFDSGIGGLSVVKALREHMPAEDIVYFADSANCPYGSRDEQFILERSVAIAEHLVGSGIKLLVTACNTACAVALEHLRQLFDVEIVGLEPAVKPAVRMTSTGRIAVIATPRTIGSARLASLIERHAAGVEVELVAASGWVEQVEGGMANPQIARALIAPLVGPVVDRGADVLVLGCTHFPFLEHLIRETAGAEIAVVESGAAIARRANDLLIRDQLLKPVSSTRGELTMLTTNAESESVGRLASRLLHSTVRVHSVHV